METVKKILSDVWREIYDIDWNQSAYNSRKARVCATFSKLSYLAIPEFEFEERGRFKLIPCTTYHEAVTSRSVVVTAESLRVGDIQRPFILFGRHAVVLGIRMGNVLFIGVRGTSSLYNSTKLYDWRVNLTARRTPIGGEARLHQGFLLAATENLSRLYHELDILIGKDDVQIYVTGHSLGGAVASIIFNILSGTVPIHGNGCYGCDCIIGARKFYPFASHRIREHFINSAYTFGTPRYENIISTLLLRSPYQVYHEEDIVPMVPARWMGYADGIHRIKKPTNSFHDSKSKSDEFWGRMLRRFSPNQTISRILWHHCIENYHEGLDNT